MPYGRIEGLPRLGIIGSGNIGAGIARLAVAADIAVIIANSRGPKSLAGLVQELGTLASSRGPSEEAAEAGDLVVLSVPLTAYTAIPVAPLRGRPCSIRATTTRSEMAGIAELDDESRTTSEMVQRHFEGVPLVKAFNNIIAPRHTAARPAVRRRADLPPCPSPVTTRTPRPRRPTSINRLRVATVDVGSLADSWRFEPEAGADPPPSISLTQPPRVTR